MCQPKIDEFLKARLCDISQKTNIPMKLLVNVIICKGIEKLEELTSDDEPTVKRSIGC